MQIKKSLLALGLMTVMGTPVAFADGFYVGAGVSRDNGNINLSHTENDVNHSVLANTSSMGAKGFGGSIFAGYGMSFDRFYLAGELNAAASSMKFSDQSTQDDIIPSTTTAQRSYKIKNNYGISVLPGFKLNDQTLLYGRLGYVKGKVQFNDAETSTYPGHQGHDVSKSDNLDGIRYGVGLSTEVFKHVNLRLEYNHTDYKAHDVQWTETTMGGHAITNINSRLHPYVDQAELAVSYSFD